jgi:hypothetical protein
MTQRERIREEARQVSIYDTPSSVANTGVTAQADDAVRWGSVIAGIFTALSILFTLSVLGLAIGLSTFDAGDPSGAFGTGAGIWGLISVLLAFGLGGYMAGSTARVRGSSKGMLNGIMVWMVTIPLAIYLLGSSVGALLGLAGDAATAAGAVTGPVIGQIAGDPAAQATAQALGETTQGAIEGAQNIPPEQVNQAVETAGRTAWGTLLWLGLGAAAALGGGYAGGLVQPATRRVATRT